MKEQSTQVEHNPKEYRFTYEHLDNLARTMTVCYILLDNKIIAYGIAICSELDIYNRKRGNMIAKGRALKALRIGDKFDKVSRNRLSPRISNILPKFTIYKYAYLGGNA